VTTRARLRSRRRGITVVLVLVILVIIAFAGSALLKVGLAQREFARGADRRLQAEWLLESGVSRALARLDVDRDYAGETWPLSAGELGLPYAGRASGAAGTADTRAAVVTIAVARVPGEASRRQIRIQTDYPRGPERHGRHSKQMLIDLEPTNRGVAP
jgi:hypothetical protein